jgi:serine/threonine protein kinase
MGGLCSKSETVAADGPACATGSGLEQPKKEDMAAAQNIKWRKGVTKAEAKKRYVLEGSLPRNCSDLLVELRTFLDEPILLSSFGQFAKDSDNFHTLMCWADIMTYKQIDEKTFDFQASQLLHIFAKYVEPGTAVCDLSAVLTTMPATWAADMDHKLKSVRDGFEQQLSKNLLDTFGQHCLQIICDSVFATFKATTLYAQSLKKLKSQYNQISINDFQYMEMLGHGSYGFVVHCKKKSTGLHYAMKIQTKVGLLDCFNDCPERVTFEKEAVASCRHPFIVSMDYAFQTETLALMVMDLGTAGTLADAMKWSETGVIEDERVVFYAAEIVLALAHIHKMGLIYRDLKPPNVLLNADGHIQLVDLGGIIDVGGKVLGYSDPEVENATAGGIFADSHSVQGLSGGDGTGRTSKQAPETTGRHTTFRSIRNAGGNTITTKLQYSRAAPPSKNLKRATSIMGTGGYMAPEMLVMLHQKYEDMKGYTKAVDYWSLGVTMFRLLTGALPFTNNEVASFIEYCETHKPEAAEAGDKKNYPLAYRQYFHKLTAVEGIKAETLEVITAFLEVDENTRLGSGPTGVNSIKTHPYFAGINWRQLEHKAIQPPYVPDVQTDMNDGLAFDDFKQCLMSIGKEGWMRQRLMDSEQKYFDSWYVSGCCCALLSSMNANVIIPAYFCLLFCFVSALFCCLGSMYRLPY